MNFVASHPVLLPVTPLVFAVACTLLGRRLARFCFPVALSGMVVTGVFTWSLIWKVTARVPLYYNLGSWGAPWGIQIRVDASALLLACTVTAVTTVILVYGSGRLEAGGGGTAYPAYRCSLFLLALAGMLGVLLSGDLFNMLMLLLVTGIAVCGLLAGGGGDRDASVALDYLLTVAAAGALMVLATGFLYSVTGALDMKKIALRLAGMDGGLVPVATVALFLFTVGFVVEAALWPASWWLMKAERSEFRPAGAFLAGPVVFVAAFAMYRLLFSVYPATLEDLHSARAVATAALGWTGVVGFVVAAVLASLQHDVRKAISYAAVSQVGLVALGLGVSNARSVAGALTAAAAGACAVAGLFISIDGVMGKGKDRRSADALAGLGRDEPLNASAFVLCSLSLVGIPFTAGFSAKRLLVNGLFDRGWYVPAVLVFVGTAVTLFYLGRIAVSLLKRSEGGLAGAGPHARSPLTTSVSAFLLGLAGVALGIFSYLVTPSL